MAIGAIYLTEKSPGAPVLSGQNGSLCSLLDWALAQKSWAIEHTATNARVYRASTGNRHRLFVAHDSAISTDVRGAVIRGCENASAATPAGLINPFPTVSQVSNVISNVKVSNAADSSARGFRIILNETFLLFTVSTVNGLISEWDFFFFGDLAGTEPGDIWATAIHVGGASISVPTTSRGMGSCVSSVMPTGQAKTFFCRNIDGSTLSSLACLGGSAASNPASLMSASNTPAMRAGYGNRVIREKVCVRDFGGAAPGVGGMQVFQRGWVPNFWNPIHSTIGTVTAGDEHTDSAYAEGSLFLLIPASATVAFILEASDTWSPPNG